MSRELSKFYDTLSDDEQDLIWKYSIEKMSVLEIIRKTPKFKNAHHSKIYRMLRRCGVIIRGKKEAMKLAKNRKV